MILIDALYINDGGGKVLLDYLISELEKTNLKVYYLLDNRIVGNVQEVKETNIIRFLPASFLKRRDFYKNEANQFSSILCFGNLPPNNRVDAKIYTYFHQLLFLKIPDNLSWKKKLMYKLKIRILNSIRKNTDYWIVQTDLVKNSLSKKYRIKTENILILPIYPEFQINEFIERRIHSYLYVSNATPHKNHKNLITAFCQFYDQNKIGELTLTVNNDYPEILNFINEKQSLGYPICNIGFVDREKITRQYKQHEYLIFPSQAESFGLGLVEAISNGCKIIGADLPYTYAVCDPSIVFDPTSVPDIIHAFSLSLQPEVKPSKSKVQNNIEQVIKLLH